MRSFSDDVLLPKVEIHVTEACNNRCGFCTTGWLNAEQRGRLPDVPREIIREQLVAAYANGARRALFQGGEPTVRADLGDLVRDAYALGFEKTTVFTNARRAASESGARWLGEMGVTWFQVSVQGGNAASHDASVRAPGAFKQTVSGIRRLVALGARVKINAVLTVHLLESLSEFADLMIALGPEEVGMDTVKPSAAFERARAAYGDELASLVVHGDAIRDAVLRMNAAGVCARLTSFPYCLARGAEQFVSPEASSTLTYGGNGQAVKKNLWKRSLQVKAETCATCAYDDRCDGVYVPYAELFGLDALVPYEVAAPEVAVAGPAPRSALGRALANAFARGRSRDVEVVSVNEPATGVFEIQCVAPSGAVRLSVRLGHHEPAYARTERFSVAFQRDAHAQTDTRVVDTIVRALARIEARLPA